jgi:hypothetical protein
LTRSLREFAQLLFRKMFLGKRRRTVSLDQRDTPLAKLTAQS